MCILYGSFSLFSTKERAGTLSSFPSYRSTFFTIVESEVGQKVVSQSIESNSMHIIDMYGI